MRTELHATQRLMEASGQIYPETFEATTTKHLWGMLGKTL
jgi:hypothetical protein